jgi:hypothetical protein
MRQHASQSVTAPSLSASEGHSIRIYEPCRFSRRRVASGDGAATEGLYDESVGDIRTHRLIYETFIRPHLPADVDPIYVELGNYLTDVSQFRDPWAHVGGKGTVWGEQVSWIGRYSLIADLFVGADEYFDLLLGKPDDDDDLGRVRVPHGLLAEWFRHTIYAMSLETTFRDGADYLIDPTEFKRLFDAHFTQYFPHEHLDYQPRETGKLNEFPQSSETIDTGDTRRIVAYLDRDIEYVGDLLTKIEQNWVRNDGTLTSEEQHDVLIEFGHACHALEDFFFHSNFVDLAHRGSRLPFDVEPWFDPEETKDDTDPEGDRVPPPESARWDRIDFRRKRQPVFKEGGDGETEFHDEISKQADIVYTASIPMPDIFHTFLDAIGHISEGPALDEAFLDQVNKACGGDAPKIALMALVAGLGSDGARALPGALMATFVPGEDEVEDDDAPLSEEDEARVKQAKKLRKKAYAAYRCLVEHDVIAESAHKGADLGFVDRSVADAISEAGRIERQLWDELTGFLDIDEDTGAARFMMLLLEQGRQEVHEATKRSRELDQANKSEKASGMPLEERSGYVASDNQSSAERIGTHSLMSKDSIRKQPLRRQAINGAGFLVSYVTKTMVAQADPATRVGEGVDWYELIRHFLTHPDQAAPDGATPWWRDALEWDRDEANRPDEHHAVVGINAAEVGRRIDQGERHKLELQYNDLVAEGERRFRHEVNTDWILGSMVWGGLVGSCAGIAGASGGSADEIVGGGLVGLAIGLGATALLSGTATAIDDRAGSVVGLALGVGTTTAVGYTVGRLIADP